MVIMLMFVDDYYDDVNDDELFNGDEFLHEKCDDIGDERIYAKC